LPEWKRRGFVQSPDTYEKLGFTSLEAEEIASRCVRTLPEKDHTIGFFVACFERKIKIENSIPPNITKKSNQTDRRNNNQLQMASKKRKLSLVQEDQRRNKKPKKL